MDETDRIELEKLVLAPDGQKATAVTGRSREVGVNQFGHSIAVFGTFLGYHYSDPALLKASLIHGLFKDGPETDPEEIEASDEDGPAVVRLAFEVTRREGPKAEYLESLRDCGSRRAQILKVADRIRNLIHLHLGIFTPEDIRTALEETSE